MDMPLDIARFAVDVRPVCVHDVGILERNREFLQLVNPAYFAYVADAHAAHLEGENAQPAALSLRAAYSHGLEALFAFLGALIQAPECVYGWLAKYQNRELESLISKIGSSEPILTKLRAKHLTWTHLSRVVHEGLVLPDPDRTTAVKDSFARLWERLARDFLNKEFQDEYNSIKHGFRAKSGGFSMAIGPWQPGGVLCPPEQMTGLGGSKFGSLTFALEPLAQGNPINFRSRRRLRNWSPTNFGNALHFIAMSLSNVVSRLRVHAGDDGTKVQYKHPTDLASFEAPWQETPGVLSSSFDYTVDPPLLTLLDKDQVLSIYKNEPSEAAPPSGTG
jgi:hypothetical protein